MGRDPPHQREDVGHTGAASDQVSELARIRKFPPDRDGAPLFLRSREQQADALPQGLRCDGLGQIVASALLNRFHGAFRRVLAGQDNHVDGGIPLHDAAQQFHAVHHRHELIQKDHIGPGSPDEIPGLQGIGKAGNPEAGLGKNRLEKIQNRGIVVDDYQFKLGGKCHGFLRFFEGLAHNGLVSGGQVRRVFRSFDAAGIPCALEEPEQVRPPHKVERLFPPL